MKGYRLKYKQVKVLKPICPGCDQVLGGNGSVIIPYECRKCDKTWEPSYQAESDLLYYPHDLDA